VWGGGDLVAEARYVLPKLPRCQSPDRRQNFLVARTGSSNLVTTEGNGRLSNTLPNILFVLGPDREGDPDARGCSRALLVACWLAPSATGHVILAYTRSTPDAKREKRGGPPRSLRRRPITSSSSTNGRSSVRARRCRIRSASAVGAWPESLARSTGAICATPYGWGLPCRSPAVLRRQRERRSRSRPPVPTPRPSAGRCESVVPGAHSIAPADAAHWREREFERQPHAQGRTPGSRPGASSRGRPKFYRRLTRIANRFLRCSGRAQGRYYNVWPLGRWLTSLPRLSPSSIWRDVSMLHARHGRGTTLP